MYPDNIRHLIYEKRLMGQTYEKIGEDLCLKKSTVYSIFNVPKKSHKKISGPKGKIGNSMSLNIKRYVENKNICSIEGGWCD